MSSEQYFRDNTEHVRNIPLDQYNVAGLYRHKVTGQYYRRVGCGYATPQWRPCDENGNEIPPGTSKIHWGD
jgi:hypothetical protein